MTKLIKILLWMVASLVLIVVLASILLPILVDPNDYKDEIAQQVHAKTGRTLTIDGDIDLSISLPLSVSLELGKLELSNAKGFIDKPFARMQGASLYVAIMPLLTDNRLDVGEIKLAGMELNLIKNKQGVTNWSDLSGKQEPAPAQVEKAKTSTENKTAKETMPAISVAGLNISDALITWTDEQARQSISLSKTNITISELIEDKPFELTVSTHIDNSNPVIKGDFTLTSVPTVSLSKQVFQLPGTQLTLDLSGDVLPGGANKTTLSGDISFDGKSQVLDINKMKLTSYDMVINGLFHANKLDSSPEFSGQVSIDQFSPKQLAATLGTALPEMKEQKALNSADAKLTFKGNENLVTISSLEANLDDTSLKGSASIKNFSKPLYGFDLTLNQLNLDYYAVAGQASSPAETDKAPADKKKTASSKSQSSAPLFPVETLRQLNLDGKLAIAQFIAGGAKMTNVVIVLKGNNGLVQLAPLKADLYKGTINLKTDIDARGKTPKLKIINELKQVQIGDLLQDTTGSQEFTGVANINANITTSGNDKDRLVKNSNGTAKLLVTDGHIKKLDILTNIRKADALLKGKAAPSESQDSNTKFTELKGSMKIKNGVIRNKDLASKSPLMELTGQGYADLPKEYLDYTLSIKLLNSLKIDDNTQGTDFKGKEFPYTIKGKFSELSEEANISKVLEQEVKKKVEDKLNKKLEEKLGDKFKGLLKF
ncbi:MAG: AsmA family protein [gamma proteobacterium symbiont of Bathyaustriella thionipta]|nr:AsmA family protein [gamma proteobacterium symbiont of Bathyaustriella thionipta]MCU7949814.1 AsmA family protein [gamma proteobacterium symbiont of Bathyaustriella thionipta]MCU7951882.1 AsmA family protein [gamma proteobacterium symbiont of Bathyaustriella thionipta]MCU7956671.1 AsmA family protein [gamma proteobacterium symbiont of Bathyaustriella thionipta]MCU7966454.1 AsmA family protein [gamma proteobacterium symbiont of Bathyaustriella thionipta]